MRIPWLGIEKDGNSFRIPWLGIQLDERCLEHRRRSTGLAAMAAALVAGGIWEYDWFRCHVFDGKIFAVLLAMAATKLSAMAWYRFTD